MTIKKSLVDAINDLVKRGYTENFKAENNGVTLLSTKTTYPTHRITVRENFRFDGMTNPEDDCILMALETDDGKRGTLVASYGAQHSQSAEVLKELK